MNNELRSRVLELKNAGHSWDKVVSLLGLKSRWDAMKLVNHSMTRNQVNALIELKGGRCEHCGLLQEFRSDLIAHHSDYSKPADTVLCRPCHIKLHRQMKMRLTGAAAPADTAQPALTTQPQEA